MKQSHVRQRLVFLEQLAHMTHGHVRLVFFKLVILELIRTVLSDKVTAALGHDPAAVQLWTQARRRTP